MKLPEESLIKEQKSLRKVGEQVNRAYVNVRKAV